MNYPIDLQFLKECKKITQRYDYLMGSWSIDSGLLHIITEVTEVKDVLRNKNDKYGIGSVLHLKLLDELADVFLTTISLVNLLGIDDKDLNDAIVKKLSVVKGRVDILEKEISGVKK